MEVLPLALGADLGNVRPNDVNPGVFSIMKEELGLIRIFLGVDTAPMHIAAAWARR
jgi:ADP-heptose:LPS heptosyltransferase